MSGFRDPSGFFKIKSLKAQINYLLYRNLTGTIRDEGDVDTAAGITCVESTGTIRTEGGVDTAAGITCTCVERTGTMVVDSPKPILVPTDVKESVSNR